MKWKKYTIDTLTGAEDILGAELNDLGVEGIEIEDKVQLTEKELEGMFVDLPLDLGGDDGKAEVSFYAAIEDDGTLTLGTENPRTVTEEELMATVKELIEEIRMYAEVGPGTITVSETENVDWENNWKAYWHAFSVGDLVIKPSWETLEGEFLELVNNGALVLDMDPGTAFGTGSHETTQLCIKGLQKYLKKGDRVLDVGCGSGILAITACALGAKEAFGTDLDECAITSSRENADRNNVSEEQFKVMKGNLLDPADTEVLEAAGGDYDLVVSNILAPIIIELQKTVANHMKPGAIWISSGILDVKEADVVAACEGNDQLEVLEVVHQGEWCSVVCRKR